MLTISEAAPYFKVGVKQLRRMCEDHIGSFAVYQGNRYLIIRSRLEAYFLNGGEQGEKEKMQKALQEIGNRCRIRPL